MPNPRLRYLIRVALKLLVMAAILMPLTTLAPAVAVEKAAAQSGRHKSTAGQQRIGKSAKARKSTTRPRQSSRKSLANKKTAVKLKPAALKLARDIEPPAPTPRPVSTTRPVNAAAAKPFPDDPPLQIGKTLYQRNGEIRQLEGQ